MKAILALLLHFLPGTAAAVEADAVEGNFAAFGAAVRL